MEREAGSGLRVADFRTDLGGTKGSREGIVVWSPCWTKVVVIFNTVGNITTSYILFSLIPRPYSMGQCPLPAFRVGVPT